MVPRIAPCAGRAKALRAAGCSQCGAHDGEGGQSLLWCPCGWAVYCGTGCQKKAWPSHKDECKRRRAEQKEREAAAAQEGGGGGGTGGEASGDASGSGGTQLQDVD